MTIRTGVQVEGHTPGDGGTTVKVSGEDLAVDVVVMSVGRRPHTDDLGPDGTSVEIAERGFVKVNQSCRTREESVWAVGDATATPQPAHLQFIQRLNATPAPHAASPPPADH